MTVMDLLKTYNGEIRVHNDYYQTDVGIINTQYQGWVRVSYMNCEVTKIELEMLNTAVLSARIVIYIDDEMAAIDPGDVEEATKEDIDSLIDEIYKDEDENNMTENEETIRIVTESYYDHEPLPGDEEDFGDHDAEEATDQEVQEIMDEAYPEDQNNIDSEGTQDEVHTNDEENEETNSQSVEKEEDDEEEATQEDIDNLLSGLYSEEGDE